MASSYFSEGIKGGFNLIIFSKSISWKKAWDFISFASSILEHNLLWGYINITSFSRSFSIKSTEVGDKCDGIIGLFLIK